MRAEEERTADWPSVSVVVPVHGDRGGLDDTLAALAAQDYPGAVEVVVVDNGDNPGLAATAGRHAGVRVVAESRPGSYAARNRGISSTDNPVVAFTDADCLPRPSWLRHAVATLVTDPAPAFAGGAIRVFPQDSARVTAAELWDCVKGLRQDVYVAEQGWAATANMVTTRATLDAVGHFDSRLMSGGDREWGTRATAHGVRARFDPDAVVDHPARRTLAELHTKIRRVTAGDVALRRAAGQPLFERGRLFGELRPNTRSIVRRSAEVSPGWTRDRARYVLVAHWLQYYFLLARARHLRDATPAASVTPSPVGETDGPAVVAR